MDRRKIFWVVVLLGLMYCSGVGNYLNSDNYYYYENAMGFGLIDFVISTIILIFFPFVCRLINKGRLELKKGNRICVWNSVVLFIVSIILMVLCDVGFVGGLGAIIFCYINKCLFVLESEESNTLKKSNSKSNKNKKRGKAKTSFCKYCGGKLDDENKCKKCGKKYFKINYKILSIILVVIIVILLLILYLLILDSDDKNSEKPMNEDLYNARHILVDDYETAELVIDLLDTGVDFCKLAKNYSKDSATSNNCGYVGSFEEGDMEFGFEEEVKSLNYNEYSSQPVQTEYGYHVIMRIK